MSLADLPRSGLYLSWSLQVPAADLMRAFQMPGEGRQGHPAQSSTKPSLQSCSTWAQSSVAFALLCVMLQPELFFCCWTHPFPPLEQLWHLEPGFVHDHSNQAGSAHMQLCSLGFFGLSVQWWRLHFTKCKEHKNIWGFHFQCTGRSCFPSVLPLLPFSVCLLWWILAPLVHARLEEGEPWGGGVAEAALENTNDPTGEEETEPVCDEYLGCSIISFLRKSTSESNFFAQLWILWWSQGIKSFSSLFF